MKKIYSSTAISVILFIVFFNFTHSLPSSSYPVWGKYGMVVSTDRIASEIGCFILKKGGNAVDAAVAMGFALAVTFPPAGNIGGGGFMVIHTSNGVRTTINYREKAPLKASADMCLNANGELIEDLNHHSYLSVGVPGTVAGLCLALEKYGTMDLKEVIKPAIKLAEKGIPLSYSMSQWIKEKKDYFAAYPASMALFFKKDGENYEPGEKFVQKDLAATLKRIAQKGRDGFYKGKTAQLIVEDMEIHGGLISYKDLENYQSIIQKPVIGTYRGFDIISMSPPSSGGIALIEMLNILEGYDLSSQGHNSAASIHLLVEAMKRAFADRARYIGDPEFNPDMPVELLISKEYAARLRETIVSDKASHVSSTTFEWKTDSEETTHFSIIDAFGNAVSQTYTLENWFGSKIVTEGAGFLLNDEMGDFNPQPGRTDSTGMIGTAPNFIFPEKRMLSSMTPTIVAKNGKPLLIIGSPGGRTIINTVLQVIINVIDYGMNIQEAINAPRIHHQWMPDTIRVEKWAISVDTIDRLERMGYHVKMEGSQGRAMGILVDPETGYRFGASDPRSPDGAAIGY